MAGKADIKVGIGADARPLEKEVARARGSVHGLARDVEKASGKMVIRPPMSQALPGAVLTGPRIPTPAPIEMPSGTPVRRGKADDGIAAKMIRRPEFNFMGRMEGLLGGLTLGGLLMWIRGAEQAAAKTKELAYAARLPTEEFVRLQEAAKANRIPVETLNAAIKDYSEGKITLQQVGEAVGIIGMKAGGASSEVKKLAADIEKLAELDKQMNVVAAGMANFGKKVVVGISDFFRQASRMAIESVAQGRAVSWWEAGEMQTSEAERDKRRENAQLEKDLRERRAVIKVEADLTDFFGDVERGAAVAEKRRVKIQAATEAREEAISRITVQAPRAGDTLARIGGFMGGRMDNRGFMLAERQLHVMEVNAEYTKQVAKILGEG